MTAPALAPRIEIARTVAFLELVFGEDAWAEGLTFNLRAIAPSGAREEVRQIFVPRPALLLGDVLVRDLTAWNHDEGRSIYFGIGLRRGRNGKAAGVALLPGLWVDLDAKLLLDRRTGLSVEERAKGKRLARARLHELPVGLQPHLVVDTGGGLHAYFLFKEPVVIEAPSDASRLRGYLLGLARRVGADPAVAHVGAMLRLPGFINPKYAERPLVTVVESHE